MAPALKTASLGRSDTPPARGIVEGLRFARRVLLPPPIHRERHQRRERERDRADRDPEHLVDGVRHREAGHEQKEQGEHDEHALAVGEVHRPRMMPVPRRPGAAPIGSP